MVIYKNTGLEVISEPFWQSKSLLFSVFNFQEKISKIYFEYHNKGDIALKNQNTYFIS